ncbi:MAG TPA: multidrug ABC transporter [Lachnospiraceae bacterium]|nr:multidrug ABC transporter [Lachnospiraceae bacterium]
MSSELFSPQLCYGLAILGTFLSAFSQILLKMQANQTTNKSFIWKFLNWRVILSYGLLFLTLAINQIALIHVPMSVMPCITATIFIWVFLMGYFILKEKISRRKVIGVAIIIIGIIISRYHF